MFFALPEKRKEGEFERPQTVESAHTHTHARKEGIIPRKRSHANGHTQIFPRKQSTGEETSAMRQTNHVICTKHPHLENSREGKAGGGTTPVQ